MYRIWFILSILHFGTCARILGYFPTPSYSHQITFQPIWKELSLRGHQVTVITANPLRDKTLKNLREIDVEKLSYDIWTKHDISKNAVGNETHTLDFTAINNAFCEYTDAQLSHLEVRDIVTNRYNEKYDLLLVEFNMPTSYPLMDVYKCPMIGISSIPIMLYGNKAVGNPQHPVLYPESVFPFSKNLTFFERVQSTLLTGFSEVLFKNVSDKLTAIMQKHYGSNVRSADDLSNDVSLILSNNNPILNVQRPNVPAAIEFSGIHIKPENPLPKDLKEIMDNAKNGVIYTSFGTNVKSSSMPEYKLKIIIDTFAELPYTVLWKFETDKIPTLPKNVFIRKWFPQQDILRHPNLKLFITQGGAQSLDEAMYTKTPLVVVPFIADQFANAKKVEEAGFGKQLQFATLNKDEFRATILEAMDEKYSKRVEELYNILTDVPMPALEKCIWWIEYVLRHKNISHMKSPLRFLPWYQYLLLDVIGFVLAALIISLYVVVFIIQFIRRKLKFDKIKSD